MPDPVPAPELVYFLAVEGHAQARFGTGQMIGCRHDRATEKLVWSPEPVGIGKAEHARYLRDYCNAVRRGDLQAVSLELLPGGSKRFIVLPGGPVPNEKNKLKPAGETLVFDATGKLVPESKPAQKSTTQPQA